MGTFFAGVFFGFVVGFLIARARGKAKMNRILLRRDLSGRTFREVWK